MIVGLRDHSSVLVLLLAWATSQVTANEARNSRFNETEDSSTKHNNGSHTYNGLSSNSIDVNDKVMQNGDWAKVPNHERGWIKPNVSLCCENPKAILNSTNTECLNEFIEYTPKINITVTYNNGSSSQINDLNDIYPLYKFSCKNVIPVEDTKDEHWYLNENGSIFRTGKQKLWQPEQYCLHPRMHSESNEYVYKLHICQFVTEISTVELIVVQIMTISAVCMILTILIYSFMGIRTNHQILFLFYLIFLCVSFFNIIITNYFELGDGLCLTNGYMGYFAVMAAFCMLTVICVSMWNNFRSNNFYVTHLKSKKKQLVIGLLFSLGGASVLTMAVVWAENSSIDDNWKPRIGEYSCWIFTEEFNISTKEGFSTYIYLYSPMFVLILINLVMFALTSVRIFQLKKEVNRVKKSKNSVPKQLSFGTEFSLYLRIFFTMGTTWILEIFAGMCSKDSALSTVADFVNASQGIIIFIMFGNVRLLYRRFVRAKNSDTENYPTQISAIRQTSTSSCASTKKLLRDDNV